MMHGVITRAPRLAPFALAMVLVVAGVLLGPGQSANGAFGSVVPARAQDVTIVSEGFEGGTFPPAGWFVVDDQWDPDRYMWDRETCEVEPGVGGSASAWALGGGSGGSALACGSAYTDAVDTSLVYGPIDTTGYPGGLRVSMRVWIDQPAVPAGWPEPFLVCASYGSGPDEFSCYQTGLVATDWAPFAPLNFPLSTGRTDNYVWAVYRDRMPAGGHVGVFVDNVVIEGIGGTSSPSPSPSESRTPGPTQTASRTATGTATVATSTATRTATSTRTGTPTRTPTRAPTGTPTRTPTSTRTSTATRPPTAGPSPTATRTAAATDTATREPTAAASWTATATLSATATETPGGASSETPAATSTDTPVEPKIVIYLPIAARRR